MINTRKIVLLGDTNVGKTRFFESMLVRSLMEQTNEWEHGSTSSPQPRAWSDVAIPTLGVNVFPYRCVHKGNNVLLNVWDCGGKHKGLGNTYWKKAQYAIVMFDVENYNIASLRKYVHEIKRVCYEIPILLVINKDDDGSFVFNGTFEGCFAMVAISCKEKRNLDAPFNLIMERMLY